jgi:hypothetical protein
MEPNAPRKIREAFSGEGAMRMASDFSKLGSFFCLFILDPA